MSVDEAVNKVKGVAAILALFGEQRNGIEINNMDHGFGVLATTLYDAAEVIDASLIHD